jgi:hypothetical protein
MPQPSLDRQGKSAPRSHDTVISRSATAALWRVLNAQREGWFLERRLRHVARMIAEEAHRQGLDADGMLVAMRREWPAVLEHRRVPDEHGMRELVRYLVRFCLEELRAKRSTGVPAA